MAKEEESFLVVVGIGISTAAVTVVVVSPPPATGMPRIPFAKMTQRVVPTDGVFKRSSHVPSQELPTCASFRALNASTLQFPTLRVLALTPAMLMESFLVSLSDR